MKYTLTFAEWGRAEFGAALRAYLSQDKQSTISFLGERLQAYYRTQAVFLFGQARMGLEIALRAFAEARPGRTEVVFPAYVCPCVPETIERCGLVPVPADIDDDLNISLDNARRRTTENTLAMIVAHMYGAPAPIEGFEQFCRTNGVFLVDDAAQVLGIEVGGRPLGSFGDCGLLSFSQSKTVVAGSGTAGGALILTNSELRAKMAEPWQAAAPGVFRPHDFISFMRDVYWQARTERLAYYFSKLKGQEEGRESPVRIEKISAVNAAIALCQLDDVAKRISGRKRVIAAFHQQFEAQAPMRLAQPSEGVYLTRVLLALPPGVAPQRFRADLARRGIQTRRPYPPMVVGNDSYPGIRRIDGRLVEIPSHSRMSHSEVKEISSEAISALADVMSVSGLQADYRVA